MQILLGLWQGLVAVPIAAGCIYALLRALAVLVFRLRRPAPGPAGAWPSVSILKPVCGLDQDLEENLRSLCTQDYPGELQVVLAAQRPDDPALPVLHRLAAEYGPKRVALVVATGRPFANGKVFNLANALRAARHEVLLISDSDVRAPRDHLRAVVAPLADPRVGYSQTLYRGSGAERWFERLELLSLHDFVSDIVFAHVTGASSFCLGSSVALRRETLEAIGGFEPLAEYLVEDFEMGRRIRARGLGLALVRHPVDVVVDLPSPRAWWEHQLYWDQNTRHARPKGFLASVLVRPVAFALILAGSRLFDPLGTAILAGTLVLRLATAAAGMALLGEREALRNLLWLPVRDVAALGTWLLALRRRSVVWRSVEFELGPDGRMLPVGPARS